MTQDPGSGTPMSERMQSLLSRAVEDQLSEQRQLAGVLADVRAQLGQLTGQLGGLQAGAAVSPQLDEALGAIAGNVRDAVRLLGERLDTVGRLVQQRGHDLAEQRAMIGELKSSVDGHASALAGLTGGLGALPAFGERIDALQSGIAGLGDRLRGLEELIAAVNALQQRSDAVDSGLRELRQAFSGVAARAAQLPGREDVETLTGRVADSVDGVDERLTRIETALPSLLERLDGLADAHGETTAALHELTDRLGDGAATAVAGGPELADLSGLREEVSALRGHLESNEADDDDVAALMERLDALHEGLLGDDGVLARVSVLEGPGTDAAAPAGLDADAVEEIVATAVADSERRLAEHVDEAILTLAEALLRRRARTRPSGLGAVLGAAEVESAAAEEVAEDDDDENGADLDAIDDDYDEDNDEDDAADSAPSGGPRWETPAPPAAGEAGPAESVPEDVDDDGPRKRRPWWRPGG
jgi:hypothetical protein